MFLTKYTGPDSGSSRIGVVAVAVPTILFFGQVGVTLVPSTNSHSPLALSVSNAKASGKVTLTFLRFACPDF